MSIRTTGDAKLFFAGVPTQPDVDKLNSKFGIPEEGFLIKWEEIEKVLEFKYGTYRFNTVVNAWRRSLYSKHNVVMGSVLAKGLMRLPPDGRIEHCKARVKSGARIIRRAVHVASSTDKSRLTGDNLKAAQHYELLGANFRLADIASASGVRLPDLEIK